MGVTARMGEVVTVVPDETQMNNNNNNNNNNNCVMWQHMCPFRDVVRSGNEGVRGIGSESDNGRILTVMKLGVMKEEF